MNKKIALLLALVAVLVIGAATSASAADIKASGTWVVESSWRDFDFNKENKDNNFTIAQRMRTQFEFRANENLKAVLGTEFGTDNWGSGMFQVGSGRAASATTNRGVGANAAGAGNLMLYKGYLDFKLPGTKINALVGYQQVALPAAFGGGSAIFDEQAAAAIVVAPINEHVTVAAGFSRLADLSTANPGAVNNSPNGAGNLDAYFAFVPVDFKGFNVTPFAAYATGGRGLNASALAGLTNNATGALGSGTSGLRAYWAGAAFTMTAFDPFKVMADFNYGAAKYNNSPASGQPNGGREGYMFDLAVDYTGLSMMTPEAFFVYSSGEKSNSSSNGKSHRMPMVSAQNFAIGSMFMQGDSMLVGGLYAPNDVMGFWAAGVSLKDIKVIDKLSSTINVIYFKGTNNSDTVSNFSGIGGNKVYSSYLTTKDSLWEFDLNNKYMIYDELSLNLDLGYLATNYDKDLWNPIVSGNSNSVSQDAYKVSLGLVYSF